MGQLFDELKRRNVIRVAVAYVVSAWLVLQIADVAINNIGAPEWVFSVFLLAGGLFFLPVLFFSWAYEITPEGVKKESEVDRENSITGSTGRKLNLITIAMLVAVVAFVLVERVWLNEPVAVEEAIDTVADTEEVIATTANEKSIAVLAFDDLSPEGDQAFFAEGLSEEILNVLAQVPGLKVAGRTSSFAFKGKDTDLREIGEVLNVAHVLEGSVRKAGSRIRVTAQLIQASDGFHLFSKTYDRNLTDVFAVQDDLAALIGEALQTELTGEENIPVVTQTSIEAYDLYLLSRQRLHSRKPELMTEAMEMLDDALAIDPDYAPALAQKALAYSLLSDAPGAYGDIPDALAVEQGLALTARALEIEPNLAEAHAIEGLIIGDLPGRRDEGMDMLRHSLVLNPNMDDGNLWLARLTEDVVESNAIYEQVLLRDPLNTVAFNNLVFGYIGLGEFDRSEALIDRVARVSGMNDDVQLAIGAVEIMRGNLSEAVRNFELAFDANPNSSLVKLNLGFALLQLGDMQRAVTHGTNELALMAHVYLREYETVDRLLKESDFLAGNRGVRIWVAANYLTDQGKAKDVIEIVNANYGDLASLLEDQSVENGYGTGYLGSLAYAYLQAGEEEGFQIIIDTMKSVLEIQNERGVDNYYHWMSQAEYHVFTGDADAAVGHLQTALDSGFASVEVFRPVFDMVKVDQRFQSFKTTALARANAERAELGMEAYEPPLGL